jgi:DNA adenine methylase
MICLESPLRPRSRIQLPMRHPGSKGLLMPKIVPLLPKHDHFISVFGGSGAEILRKPRSKLETFNDLNRDITNLFAVLRSESSRRQVLRWLQYTPHGRALFEDCVALLASGNGSPVERAWAYLVVANQGRATTDATIMHHSSWGYRRKFGRRDRWPVLPYFVERVGQRFKDVQLENAAWEDILKRYDSFSSVLMCDPPYPAFVRQSPRLYKHEMTDGDHERLLDAVQDLKSFVILCSYENELYRKKLDGWWSVEFPTRCAISPRESKPPRIDVVWFNYDPDEDACPRS